MCICVSVHAYIYTTVGFLQLLKELETSGKVHDLLFPWKTLMYKRDYPKGIFNEPLGNKIRTKFI